MCREMQLKQIVRPPSKQIRVYSALLCKRYSSVTQAPRLCELLVHDALVHGVQEAHLLADCIRRLGFGVG